MNNKPTCACPHCGEIEFITPLNSCDRYEAIGDKLHWRKTETTDCAFELYCRECGERAPAAFENTAQ